VQPTGDGPKYIVDNERNYAEVVLTGINAKTNSRLKLNFKSAWGGGGSKVHSTLRPLNGLLCQPRVIMIMEKSVE
jgi:hypothetical protein